jgi:hypothetical protein
VGDQIYGSGQLTLVSDLGLGLVPEYYATVVPPSPAGTTTGERYKNISETLADAGLRFSSTGDIAIGSQIHYKTLLNASAVAQDIDLLTPRADGSISIDDGVTLPATVLYRVNLDDGEGWSDFATLTITTADVDTPVLTGDSEVFYVAGLNTLVAADISELVSTGSWDWEVDSGSLPPGVSINISTGAITGRPGELGTFAAVITATGSGGAVEITVNFGVVTAGTIVNQSLRQIGFRAIGSTAGAINGDMLAAMVSDLGDDAGTINELLTRWLQYKLSSSTDSLQALMAEAAADRGVSRWQEIADVAAIGT